MQENCFFLILFFCFFLLYPGCEKDLTPVDNTQPEIKLTVEDVGVTEVWLHINIHSPSTKSQITISRNDSTIKQFNNLTTDTLIYDSGLLPNHDYNYTAALSDAEPAEASSSVEITTMDTTSHDFTWETFTWGDHSSSVLYDVAIINENDIWATGEIYLRDSIGQTDPQPYGAVHWNGTEWELMKVPYHDFGSTTEYPGKLKTVYAFDSNNVYVASSANLLKWDGNSWTEKAYFMTGIPFNGQVKKMWASSEDDIYCVGNGGAIYHYNGQTWQRIESGTDLQVYDIYGQHDNSNENYLIYSVAAYQLHSHDKIIFEIKDSEVIHLPTNPIPASLHGIWFKLPFHHYVVGSGIYKKSDIYSNKPWEPIHYGVSNYYIYAISGNDINDIVMCGSFGELLHYNGMTWKSYRTIFSMDIGALKEIAIKDNLIIAVGYKNSQAVIVRGTR